MSEHSEEKLDRVPKVEPKLGEKNVTVRLSGQWLARWNSLVAFAGDASPSDMMREALSLYFAAASLDASGAPIELILRRRDAEGAEMAPEDMVDYLGLPTIQAYRASRRSEKTQEKKE